MSYSKGLTRQRSKAYAPADLAGIRFIRLPGDVVEAIKLAATKEKLCFAAVVQLRLATWLQFTDGIKPAKYMPDDYEKIVKYINLSRGATNKIDQWAKLKGWQRSEVVRYALRKDFSRELEIVERKIKAAFNHEGTQ